VTLSERDIYDAPDLGCSFLNIRSIHLEIKSNDHLGLHQNFEICRSGQEVQMHDSLKKQ
jgi:hypothetical protein